jgi:hypothetical protein
MTATVTASSDRIVAATASMPLNMIRGFFCSPTNAALVGADVDLRLGSLPRALSAERFDVVVCNPPCMPVGTSVSR